MKITSNKIILAVLVIIAVILFTVYYSSLSKNEVTEAHYETPEIFRDNNLGAELPFIIHESESQLIFYNYMGVFIYDLTNEKMLHAFIPTDYQFYSITQVNQSTVVDFNIDENTVNIYKSGNHTYDYFYVYDLRKSKLYKYPIEKLKITKTEYMPTGKMDTTDWSVWSLSYTSGLSGKTYYPFRSIAK
jgi:hypothetical protein